MWNKDRFKDPTTVKPRTPEPQPRESVLAHPFAEDLSQEPPKSKKATYHEKELDRYRWFVRNNPYPTFNHSACTSYYCLHAIGNKADSWNDLNTYHKLKYEEQQRKEIERKRLNSL